MLSPLGLSNRKPLPLGMGYITLIKKIGGRMYKFCESLALCKSIPIDPDTGLAPCGCGMPAICVVKTEIMYDGKKRVKYSVKCPKNHVHTDWFDTKLQAHNYWHRAMGYPIKV